MTSTRIFTAIVFVPLILYLVYFAPLWMQMLAMAVVIMLSVFEMSMLIVPPLQALGQPLPEIKTARRGTAVGLPLCTALVSGLFFLAFYYHPQPVTIIATIVTLACIGASWRGSIDRKMGSFVGILVSFCYACLPWLCVWYLLASKQTSEVFLLFSVVWLSEAAAYFGGIKLGKRPLTKEISPAKTLEGTVCALVVGSLVATLLAPFLQWQVPFFVYPLVGFIGAALAAAGDLLESLCKRFAGANDSGSILPGHGGMLDCTDGVLVAAPIFLLWLTWFN